MKVKAFGFRWKKPLPGHLSIQDFYAHAESGGHSVSNEYEFYLCKAKFGESFWWVGVILRIRDSKNFTALKTKKDGKRILSAESLRDGKLVEPSFLIANTATGNGLFSSHHLSASLPTFSFIAGHQFRRYKDEALRQALHGVSKRAEMKRIRAEFKGKLELEQFCHPRDFEVLVKQFEKISRAEWTISTLGAGYKPFLALWDKAKSKKFVMTYDEQWAGLDGLHQDIIDSKENPNISEIKVSGKMPGGIVRDVYLNKDTKLILDERDYDGIVGSMSLDLDRWQASLADSGVIGWLVSLASDRDIRLQLERE